MERRRSESRGSSNSSCASPDLSHLQSVVDQKEKVITKLESEVEEQKKLRLQDAKQVEVKAAKIKEWVAHKLKELEDQNETLREENRKYNDQLKTLEGRLEGASPESRRKIESAINSLNRKKGIATPSLPLGECQMSPIYHFTQLIANCCRTVLCRSRSSSKRKRFRLPVSEAFPSQRFCSAIEFF